MIATIYFCVGFLLGGVHHLIVVTASADVGQNAAIKNSKSATSTCTGIIDGTGAIGVSVGQFMLGRTTTKFGWYSGFLYIVIGSISLTLVPLFPCLMRDIKDIVRIRNEKKRERMIDQHKELPLLLNPSTKNPSTKRASFEKDTHNLE